MIDHGDYVINYCEISVEPKFQTRGTSVQAGEKIGVIIANNIAGSSMLHFELYTPGTTINAHWCGSNKPPNLLDPTEFLQKLSNKKQ